MTSFKLMTSIEATYEPQSGQSFRCSKNFPHWKTPKTGTLKFVVTVPDGYPQPSFAIDHDKSSADTRWYSNLSNEVQIDINSEDGSPGKYSLYVGTTSKLPSGFDGKKTYKIDVYVCEGSFIPAPPGYKMMTSVVATYQPQVGQSFRCSENFPNWNTPQAGTLKFVVTVPDGYPQPSFAIDHDKSSADTRWYSNLSNEVQIDINSEDGSPGKYSLYVGTTSKLPLGFDGSKEYLITVYVYEGNSLPDFSISDANKYTSMQKYAPYVYMDENESYFPSTVEFTFPYLERYCNSDGNYWVKTKKTLSSESDVLPYFKGDLDQAQVYAFWVEKKDNFKEITYFFYYPYNRGKEVLNTIWGNHVGDWEHVTIRFSPKYINNQWTIVPIKVYLSAHDKGNLQDWNDTELVNSSPRIFSAQGSHAMYFTAGEHPYKNIVLTTLTDICSKGKVLDCSQNGKIVPFDYSEKKGLNGNAWPTWMSNNFTVGGENPKDPASGAIFRWGNTKDGCHLGQCRLEDGPTGPISKSDVWDLNVFE